MRSQPLLRASLFVLVFLARDPLLAQAEPATGGETSGAGSGKRDESTPAQTNADLYELTLPPGSLPSAVTAGRTAPPVARGGSAAPEVEPNNTPATATPLGGASFLMRAPIYPNGDVDYYSFSASAGDRIYAALMTNFSPGSTDTILDLLDTDGATVIETDDNDGSFSGSSSVLAGARILNPGTYYLRVRAINATVSVRPYELHFRLQSGAPAAEAEPNDTPATATPLPANGWVSGRRDPALATEQDWYSFTANAGDTIFLGLDLDPERDAVQWNGRLGIALFGDAGNQILVVDDPSAGSAANPLSESLFMTVKASGTYYAFVDSATAATGGPTATYHLSVRIQPPANEGVNCTTYASTDVPQTIGPAAGLVSSTIVVPGHPRIQDLDVGIVLNHTLMGDIDAQLRSPAGNDNGLFTDIGAAAAGGQSQMDVTLDDEAAINPAYTVLKGMVLKPEVAYRLSWFDGEDAGGVWTLDLRDDGANANGGTLTGWSLRICEPPPPAACAVSAQTPFLAANFESGAAGFTHTGTLDEWELGLPATLPTTTANPLAGFDSCGGGVSCWKTDLDNTYDLSASQDLLSPVINLATASPPLTLRWAHRLQMESATFDHYSVEVREVGNPANSRTVFEWLDGTMTNAPGNPAVNLPASAGWAVRSADVSAFAGKTVEVRFHVDSDTSVNFSGVAVDDVLVSGCPAAHLFRNAVLATLTPTAAQKAALFPAFPADPSLSPFDLEQMSYLSGGAFPNSVPDFSSTAAPLTLYQVGTGGNSLRVAKDAALTRISITY